jgi:hypothetical protein
MKTQSAYMTGKLRIDLVLNGYHKVSFRISFKILDD